jgi:predicted RNase H-like HicB family nuclease
MSDIIKIRLDLELDIESGVYTVTSPDVPGLVTEGSTPEEITRNVQEALEGLLKVWSELGIETPMVLRQQIAPIQTVDVLVTV